MTFIKPCLCKCWALQHRELDHNTHTARECRKDINSMGKGKSWPQPVVELRKKLWGQHRGAENSDTSTPCITWGSTTAVGENPHPPPRNSSPDPSHSQTSQPIVIKSCVGSMSWIPTTLQTYQHAIRVLFCLCATLRITKAELHQSFLLFLFLAHCQDAWTSAPI